MENAISVKGLTKTYSDFKLDDVSFDLPKGSIMGFIGENGSGKTTTIKAILNLINIDSGEITILGNGSTDIPREIKQKIGVVLDESFFYQELRSRDIPKILKNIYLNFDQKLYDSYIKKFNLPENKTIKQFSKGMKMKLQIACALSHKPQLLILDEPTSGLDPIVRSEMLDIFMDFIQDEKNSILLSSHITSDLEKVADYITFIHNGNIILSKQKDDLLCNFAVIKCGQDDFLRIDKTDVVAFMHNKYCIEVMVNNKESAKLKYRGMTIDNTTLDEIMLFLIKGETL